MKTETFYSCEVCHKSFTDFDTCKEHEETCKRMRNERAIRLLVIFKDGRVCFYQEKLPPTEIDRFINLHMSPQLNGGSTSIFVAISCWESEVEKAREKLFTYLNQVFNTTFKLVQHMANDLRDVNESSITIPYLAEQVYKDYKSNNHKG